jgi:transcriptional regulator
MYIPKHNEEKNRIKLLEFMRRYSFAALVSEKENLITATHLPFVIEENGDNVILKSHMAKANRQWRSFTEGKEVLVIFSEPHAYISPSLYDHKRNVPTWNYIAVHAYGIPQIINDRLQTELLLELMFEEFEKSYKTQYDELDSDYRDKQLKGIVAFEIKVKRLEGKFKLSQNKTPEERERIIDSLKSQTESVKSDLTKFMKK